MGKIHDNITFKKWDKSRHPRKILVIRIQAIGDTSLTLPVCAGFRKTYPSTSIDFLTGNYSGGLIRSVNIFDNVFEVPEYYKEIAYPSFIKKFIIKSKSRRDAHNIGNLVKKNNYDIVIDLQNNRNSKIIRKLCGADYWSEFDRFAPKPSSERTLDAFYNAGFDDISYSFSIKIKDKLAEKAKEILRQSGHKENENLILLNPAGLWVTRNWQIENYAALAELILKDTDSKFIVLGDSRIKSKAGYLKNKLGSKLIDLSGKTSLHEALAIISLCSAAVSEDSALFHIAWALGIPSLLMLGSTNSTWACHKSAHVICLASIDLACGNCMKPKCRFGDVRCLSRYTPGFVYENVKMLMKDRVR